MTQEETIEGNKLIAIFEGKKLIGKEEFNKLGEASYIGENKGVDWGIIEFLNYHRSWNAIMPVYKKCYDIWREHLDTSELCKGIFEDIWDALWKCNREAFFEGIVEFVEWYNKYIANGTKS